MPRFAAAWNNRFEHSCACSTEMSVSAPDQCDPVGCKSNPHKPVWEVTSPKPQLPPLWVQSALKKFSVGLLTNAPVIASPPRLRIVHAEIPVFVPLITSANSGKTKQGHVHGGSVPVSFSNF